MDVSRFCQRARSVAVLLILLVIFGVFDNGGCLPAAAQDLSVFRAATPPQNAIWVESLDLRFMTSGYNRPLSGRNIDGYPMTIGGVVYPHGIGTAALSRFVIDLKGSATRFQSLVAIDDQTDKGKGSDIFSILVDGKKVAESGVMHNGDTPQLLSVDLTGAQQMTMIVARSDSSDTNYKGDWAGAFIQVVPGTAQTPVAFTPQTAPHPAVILADDPQPEIHGPAIVGASPKRPFLFLIPATGTAPLTFSCADLPPGLKLDAATGILSGAVEKAGTYTLPLVVKGPGGEAASTLTLLCGDHKLSLTPTLGWNAWNIYGEAVTAADIRTAADWLVKTGLSAHGYSQITIDDTWQGGRDKKTGEILTNHHRFPDMKALADYVHSKGLKLGISSAPTEHTCGGYAGSLDHEEQDADTYAAWGMDYLKYSWCPVFIDEKKPPKDIAAAYKLMGDALDKSGRDIVYAIDTFGRNNPWDWGARSNGNSWETSQSLYDSWDVLDRAVAVPDWMPARAAPGHWNYTGPLQIGRLGYPNIHWSHLTVDEQQTQVTMDCLLASPLILSCDLTQLDPNTFHRSTFALLANDDVLAVDQDPLGAPASSVNDLNGNRVWVRPLADGTKAVALFNSNDVPVTFSLQWSSLNYAGGQPVRDLWQRKDLGTMDGYTVSLQPHGSLLLKVGTPGPVKLPS